MKYFPGLPTVLACVFLFACNKHYEHMPDPNITFAATINSSNEVPANNSMASGTATATYNSTSKILSVTVIYTGLGAATGYICKGAAGINGSAVFTFSALNPPIYFNSAPLDAGQEMDLLSNLYYVNLHTTLYPGGEIRGQLLKQ